MADITEKSKELLIHTEKSSNRISELPDGLISQILSHLPTTEEAARTSVLSTRWRNLWLWVPRLRLDYREFSGLDAFVSIGDRFFGSESVSCIDKLELTVSSIDKHSLTFDQREDGYIASWVVAAAKRKLQHLRLQYHAEYFDSTGSRLIVMFYRKMPLSLYTCETLVSLNLSEMTLPDAEFVSLPCLKTMRLNRVWFPDDATFERLVSSSSCPVLEELEISEFWNSYARVLSRSLKKLSLNMRAASEVVIDAPRLGFLKIDATLRDRFVITNMDYSNVKLVISLSCIFGDFDEASLLSNRNTFCSFLSGISEVRDMTILGHSCKGCSHSKWLPTILESFRNLKSFSWECDARFEELHLDWMNQISFSSVPECLLSSLEFVDFRVPLSGVAGELKVVRYFLENSAILKKLTLHFRCDCSTKDEFVKELLRIPKGSTKCEVVIL